MAHKALRAITRKEQGSANFEIKIAWITAHLGAEGNELVDKAAKEVVERMSDSFDLLPLYLAKCRSSLPARLSALKQVHNTKLRWMWRKKWKASPRYVQYAKTFKDSCFHKESRGVTRGVIRNQLSLLIQLHTGHAPLNRHLHHIGKFKTEICNSCKDRIKSMEHYLLECRAYKDDRHKMVSGLEGDDKACMRTLFSKHNGIKALLQCVEDTKRLQKTFSDVSPHNLIKMDDELENAGTGKCDYNWPQDGNEEQVG
ncbi:hypothetical protein J132_05011 [Termitomyces sp. J132]|nr:hypothetical protein J132_05011 [Termitomyces sp. J132]